jgi:hypothetical protein
MSFAPRARGKLLSLQANEQGGRDATNRKWIPRAWQKTKYRLVLKKLGA